jgi:hypothetical protein
MATQGLLSLPAGIAILFGAKIGTGIAAIADEHARLVAATGDIENLGAAVSRELAPLAKALKEANITPSKETAALLERHTCGQRARRCDQAAKVAGLSLDGFMDVLGAIGVAAVDYPAKELAAELDVAL